MEFDLVREFCLALPGATEEVQWGSDLLFKVAGKTFVFAGMNPPHSLSIKCSEEDFNELIEREGIVPAPYLARNKWVMIENSGKIPRRELESRIRMSYDLIVSKLPKRTQAELKRKS